MYRKYNDPNIIANTFLGGSTANSCGARLHYIADHDPNTNTYSNLVLVHPTYSLRNGLYFRDNGGSPKEFELKLDPTDVLDLGLYNYAVVIEMEDYPKSKYGNV